MAFVNNYASEPEIPVSELYGPDPYDLNFIFPIPLVLSTDKLRLVPFVPRVHAVAYFDGIRGHESMFQHMPIAVEQPTSFLRFTEACRRQKGSLLFAIPTTLSGKAHLRACSGFWKPVHGPSPQKSDPAIVLPAFQRTHVASHAVGLLLKYILELPPSGLGFRRVKWSASPINTASNNLAKRMGFKLEGVMRWKFTLPTVEGNPRPGKEARAGDAGNGLQGRDSNEWGLCWDDWEEGGRELVERAFARSA
ncbi:hypothetical protein JVU11DRAFT_2879 [Chiua virens]|nr:hypothetical protein JVU11DRAFT_2879 [Chiua virens]